MNKEGPVMRHEAKAKWLSIFIFSISFLFLAQCGGSGGEEDTESVVIGPQPCSTEELLTRGTYSWEVNDVDMDCPDFDILIGEIIEGIEVSILEQEIPAIVMPDYEEIDPYYTISGLTLPLPNHDILIVNGQLSISNGHILLETNPETITGAYEGFPYQATVTGSICPDSESELTTDFDADLVVRAGIPGGGELDAECNLTVTLNGSR